MMRTQESVGSVPQEGVNPQARQAPPAPAAPQPQQPPQGGGELSPEDIEALRQDPEIAEAVAKFMGRRVDMAQVPDDMLIQIAGMVQKLGVDGAIAEFERLVPPEVVQQLRAGAGAGGGGAPR